MEETTHGENQAQEFTVDDMQVAAGASTDAGEVAHRIEFRHATTGELVGYFLFSTLLAPSYRRFQDIASGTLKRKPNRGEAVKYLFEKCCVGFELADKNARLNTGKYPNAKVMFLQDPKLEMVVDAAINEFLGSRPDVEDVGK